MVSLAVYVFGSVLLVSLMSLLGIAALGMDDAFLHRTVFYLVSFAAGTLFGTAFLHLLPHAAEQHVFDVRTGLYLLSGVVLLFLVENYVHWHHEHRLPQTDVQPFSYMILLGDSVHNIIDGVIIAAGYLASIPLGVATTIAVMLHEIPQEIGDFAVLIHGGFSFWKAVLYNFVSALTALIGAGVILYITGSVGGINRVLLPFAAGAFIYIAGTDLLPELRQEDEQTITLLQMAVFALGILLTYALTFAEELIETAIAG